MTPTHQTLHSAGADVCAAETVTIEPGQVKLVPTGAYTPEEWRANNVVYMLAIRSSIALKRGLSLANGVGIIDSEYADEIKVMLHNHTDNAAVIEKGERIAQLIAVNFLHVYPVKQVRRTGGFGSTS